MEIQDIVQKWYTLASGGEIEKGDVFFRFVAVWVAFNALYTSRHSDEVGDWNQVRSFAGEPAAIDLHRKLVRDDREYQRAIEALQERGVYDNLRRPRRIRDKDNLTQIASCVYQVRNNLFHGGKMPGNPRDERLADAGYVIVSRLIKPYLDGR